MIYVVLYSIIAPGTPTGMIGGQYYGWAYDLGHAEIIYNELELTGEIFRKEIWTDNGKGYRQLVRSQKKGEFRDVD